MYRSVHHQTIYLFYPLLRTLGPQERPIRTLVLLDPSSLCATLSAVFLPSTSIGDFHFYTFHSIWDAWILRPQVPFLLNIIAYAIAYPVDSDLEFVFLRPLAYPHNLHISIVHLSICFRIIASLLLLVTSCCFLRSQRFLILHLFHCLSFTPLVIFCILFLICTFL